MDKFGRHGEKRKLKQGPKGEGFKLTEDGDYDIKLKRLRFVNKPIEDGDAVNLQTLRESTIPFTIDELNVENRRVINVKAPEKSSDAVNLETLTNNCIIITDVIDGKGKIITNVENNSVYNEKDVANKNYINEHFVRYNYNNVLGNINAKNNLIINVVDPQSAQDAATKSYVDKRTPGQGAHHWNFFYKRLMNVTSPTELGDAVNLRYFNENSPRIDSVEGKWSFNNYRIGSIAKPLHLDDAVNKQYLKEVIGDLGYSIYKQINKGKRAKLLSETEWKSRALVNSWDQLFA